MTEPDHLRLKVHGVIDSQRSRILRPLLRPKAVLLFTAVGVLLAVGLLPSSGGGGSEHDVRPKGSLRATHVRLLEGYLQQIRTTFQPSRRARLLEQMEKQAKNLKEPRIGKGS